MANWIEELEKQRREKEQRDLAIRQQQEQERKQAEIAWQENVRRSQENYESNKDKIENVYTRIQEMAARVNAASEHNIQVSRGENQLRIHHSSFRKDNDIFISPNKDGGFSVGYRWLSSCDFDDGKWDKFFNDYREDMPLNSIHDKLIGDWLQLVCEQGEERSSIENLHPLHPKRAGYIAVKTKKQIIAGIVIIFLFIIIVRSCG